MFTGDYKRDQQLMSEVAGEHIACASNATISAVNSVIEAHGQISNSELVSVLVSVVGSTVAKIFASLGADAGVDDAEQCYQVVMLSIGAALLHKEIRDGGLELLHIVHAEHRGQTVMKGSTNEH